jgi:hypothetical protein
MRLVILRPGGRGRHGRGARREWRAAAAAAIPAWLADVLPRWGFALLVSFAFLAVTACGAERTRTGFPVAHAAAPAPPPAALRMAPAVTPRPGGGAYVALAERARREVALQLHAEASSVRIEFETPSAARLLLPPTEALRVGPRSTPGEWVVVFDAVPGRRPELRLPFRAELMPAPRAVEKAPQ